MLTGDKAYTASTNRRRAKASLTATLVLSFGGLIVAGMILVQGISMWSAQKKYPRASL